MASKNFPDYDFRPPLAHQYSSYSPSPLPAYHSRDSFPFPSSTPSRHATPNNPNSYPAYPPHDTNEPGPLESQDDIPLETHVPKNASDRDYQPGDEPLRRQDSDTYPLNPTSRPRKHAKNRGFFAGPIPWVVYTLTLIQLSVFIAELVKASVLTGSPIETKPQFNPMIGPSAEVLINMGARYVVCMRNTAGVQDAGVTNWPCPNNTDNSIPSCSLSELCGFNGVPNPKAVGGSLSDQPAPNQWFRFITPIFLHGGIIHITGNLLLQLLLARDMEKAIGPLRFALVYFSAGIFGFIMGANFAGPAIASTGCSGCLFGIIGLVFIDLFYTWGVRKHPWRDLIFLIIMVAIEVVIGLLPTGLDNFSHLGGLVMGLALGVVLLHSPNSLRTHIGEDPHTYKSHDGTIHKRRHKPISRDELVYGTSGASVLDFARDPLAFFQGRKPLWWAWWVFRLVALILAIVGFILLINNFYANTSSNCSWCKYLACINHGNWCDVGQLSTTTYTTTAAAPGATLAPTSPAKFML